MISLIHPSRGRPQQALSCFNNWLQKSKHKDFEYILGIDHDDTTNKIYYSLFEYLSHDNAMIYTGNNTSLVDCVNKLAKLSKGDIIIYLSDDFDCPMYWDELIIKASKGIEKFILKVDDGCQKFNAKVLTIPIMSRPLFNELGYFFYPEYRSMWCDVDLYYSTEKYMFFLPDVRFQHNHWVNSKAIKDETYKRSEANFATGKQVFIKRAKDNKWNYHV